MPARVSDDDPRCGLASLQKFQGEDLDSSARTKYQQEQLREWSRLQQEEQRRAQNQQQAADQLFYAKQNELDQRAVELQRAEEQCRRDINRFVRNYNDELVSQYQTENTRMKTENILLLDNQFMTSLKLKIFINYLFFIVKISY